MEAIYVSNNSFKVAGNEIDSFLVNRRVKLSCGVDGEKYATILTSSYSDLYTTVIINEDVITTNLISILYSVVKPGQEGNLIKHFHTSSEGDGGEIDYNFLTLTDTPITYSGTEGFYAKSTGSGIEWATVSNSSGISSFLELTDTPSTYSGTEGFYAKSTGSGIEFVEVEITASIYSDTTEPDEFTAGDVGDYYLTEVSGTLYKKFREVDYPTLSAKSIILDCADNYIGSSYMGIRSVDFWYSGNKIVNIKTTNFVSYATTSLSSSYLPGLTFDTSLSKTGSATSKQWISSSTYAPQRLICVHNSPIIFDEIRINNYNWSGSEVNKGVKNIKIYTSTDEIIDTTYGSVITNNELIYDGVLDEHILSDEEDEQILDLILPEVDAGWDIVLNTTKNFTDLLDTPVTYHGTEGSYIKTTISGLNFVDGIILVAPDLGEWILRVTNSGTLFTESI